MRKVLRAAGAALFGVWILFAAGCGGGGGAEDAVAAPPATQDGTAASPAAGQDGNATPPAGSQGASAKKWQLFVVDRTHQTLALFADVRLAAGSLVSPEATLPVERLSGPLAYDASRDILYAGARPAAGGAPEILVFANASTLGPAASPTRRIGLGNGLLAPAALQVDAAADALYVGGSRQPFGGTVQVFEGASRVSGTVAPTRMMTTDQPIDRMVIDSARAVMYAFGFNSPLRRWKGMNTANPQPDGVIATDNSTDRGLALDATRDRLYVTKSAGVLVVNAASTASASGGAIAIQSRLGLAGPAAYDAAHDRLYLSGLDQVFIVEGVNQLPLNAPATAFAVDLPPASEITAFAFP